MGYLTKCLVAILLIGKFCVDCRPDIPLRKLPKRKVLYEAEEKPSIKEEPHYEKLDTEQYLKKPVKYPNPVKNDDVPPFLYKPECQRNSDESFGNFKMTNLDEDLKMINENHHENLGNEDTSIEKFLAIPHCSEDNSKKVPIVILSTLDGQVTALDHLNGNVLWNHELDPNKPQLVTSSVEKLEVSTRNKWVQLIPSLEGRLYLYDGLNVESLPVTTKTLLTSSYKFTEDNLFTGWSDNYVIGILPETGEIIYDCHNESCNRYKTVPSSRVLVVTRDTQTIHSMDPKTGEGRWNFSVGQQHVNVAGGTCQSSIQQVPHGLRLRFSVPDGLVSAFDSDSNLVWSQKLPSPIAVAWTLTQGTLEKMDLFANSHMPPFQTLSEERLSRSSDISEEPWVHMGTHDGRLYLQETRQNIRDLFRDPQLTGETIRSKVQVLAPLLLEHAHNTEEVGSVENHHVHSHPPAVPSNGTYVDQEVKENLWMSFCSHYLNLGWSFYSSLCCVFLPVAYFLYQMRRASRNPDEDIFSYGRRILFNSQPAVSLEYVSEGSSKTASHPEVQVTPPTEETDLSLSTHVCQVSQPIVPSEEKFKSHFSMEYTFKKCLGKGGFGIVFHVKNNLDKKDYAVKRITLPRKEDSKDRVMREVIALAKLEHKNIVRYSYSWIEYPPEGWIENYDMTWRAAETGMDSGQTTEYSESSLGPQSTLDSSVGFYPPDNQLTSNDTSSSDDSDDDSDDDSGCTGNTASANPADISSGGSDILFEESAQPPTVVEGPNTSAESAVSDSLIVEFRDRSLTAAEDKKRSRTKSLRQDPRSYLYIRMELCQRDTLKEWLRSQEDRNLQQMLSTFNDIVHGVEFIHDQGLIHRDLKPTNIFFSCDKQQIKVGDFGLVTDSAENDEYLPANAIRNYQSSSVTRTLEVGTTLYMSPELKTDDKYDHKVDIFSLGLIFLEMLVYFKTDTEKHATLRKAREGDLPDIFHTTHTKEAQLLREMLHEDGRQRPTTRGLRSSEPLKQFQHDLDEIQAEERYILKSRRTLSEGEA